MSKSLVVKTGARVTRDVVSLKPIKKRKGGLHRMDSFFKSMAQEVVSVNSVVRAFKRSGSIRRKNQAKNGRVIQITTKKVLDSFRLTDGVSLKTKNMVLRNRKRVDEFIDSQGNRRISRRLYERMKKTGLKSRSMPKKLSNFPKRISDIQRLNLGKDHPLSNTSRDESVINSKRMSINSKNYRSFLKEIRKDADEKGLRRYSFISQLSQFSNQDFQKEEEENAKLYDANQRRRIRENYHSIVNKPVDKSSTYQKLKKLTEKHEKNKVENIRKQRPVRPRDKGSYFSKSFGVGLTTTTTNLDLSTHHFN